jgi:hypothetical protein
MPMAGNFTPDDHSLVLTVTDATVRFDSLEVNELKSIWPPRYAVRSASGPKARD